MNDRIASESLRIIVWGVAWLFVCAASLAQSSAILPAPERVTSSSTEARFEVLARGPVHEAFAEPVVFNPRPGIVAKRKPYDRVEELIPVQKPAGTNIVWIPGYWSWDEERNDFIWVSGLWRKMPPGREWIPGYWTAANSKYQWVSGYWAAVNSPSVEYLPEPPNSLETGPAHPAPSEGHIWIPGCWYWLDARYAWRPGYFIAARPNWLWMPAHHVWSPRGFIFVDGYWDYPFERRGLPFAPVYFEGSVHNSGYRYSPRYIVNVAQLIDHLFVWPRYHHYCFGDYYAVRYSQTGILPWFTFHRSRSGFDPIFAHHPFHHRLERDWEDRVRDAYRARFDGQEHRPARTVTANTSQQEQTIAGIRSLVSRLDQETTIGDSALRLERISERQRQEIARLAKDLNAFRRQRVQMESDRGGQTRDRPSGDGSPSEKEVPKDRLAIRLERSRSPIASSTEPELTDSGEVPLRPQVQQSDSDDRPNSKLRQTEREADQLPGNPKSKPDRPRRQVQPPRDGDAPDSLRKEPKLDQTLPKKETPQLEPKPKQGSPKSKPPQVDPKPKQGTPETAPSRVEPKPKQGSPKPKPPSVEPKPKQGTPELETPKLRPQPEKSRAELQSPRPEIKLNQARKEPQPPKRNPKPEKPDKPKS